MKSLWNCVQFWLCCVVTLSFSQVLSELLLLPPLFSVGQVLWMSCLIIPVLSISIIATPMDQTIMQRATGKNQCIVNGEVNFIAFIEKLIFMRYFTDMMNMKIIVCSQVALFVIWCYGSKFLPTIITVVLSQCTLLLALCPIYLPSKESTCSYVYPDLKEGVFWGGWSTNSHTILIVQHFALVLLVLHFGNFIEAYIVNFSL